MAFEKIQDRCVGRWKSILPQVGIDARYLSGKHTDCPVCRAGKDRFRFTDLNGDGRWICNQCGSGSGIDLVMKVRAIPFAEAKRQIEQILPVSEVAVPKAQKSDEEAQSRRREQMSAMWKDAKPLDGYNSASAYLKSRGIWLAEWPKYLRSHDNVGFYDKETQVRTSHHGMLARFIAPDDKSSILHRTYLDPMGEKAKLPEVKKVMPGIMPRGGAVRLFPPAETIGIAEGIETALSAAILFGVPVWAGLTAGGMLKWQPPTEAKCVMVFADNDSNFVGQHTAYSLAYDLNGKGHHVDVRIPDHTGEDWNDVLQGQGKPSKPFALG